jgi:hypothetical protein
MYYNIINGIEINPELTISMPGRIYINEGTFENDFSIAKFEKVGIDYNCSEWVDNGYTRINVYYNPDTNKISLNPENIVAPSQTYGYHLGGITLKQTDDNGVCINEILLPDNGVTIHNKYFNYEYDPSYLHLYHVETPENIFDDGFDEGFDETIDPIDEVNRLF